MLPVGCRCKPLQNAVTCQNSAPAARAEYCDERVCLLVCLSVCLHAYAKNHSSGITSHRQPRQCRESQGHSPVKVAQSDPNYVSRLLLDCVGLPVFHKTITPSYLLYRS